MTTIAKRQQTVNTSRTAAGDTFSALVIQIFRLHGLLSEAGDALARPTGQSTARWQVLAGAEHGPATVAQLARMLELTRQSVQRVANVLVAEGFAAYEPNPKDKRADLLRLTESGQAALQEIQARQRVWADELGEAIGEAELEQAQKLLARVAEAVGRIDPLHQE